MTPLAIILLGAGASVALIVLALGVSFGLLALGEWLEQRQRRSARELLARRGAVRANRRRA